MNDASTTLSPGETSFPRSEIRVLLLEGISQTAADAFREAGYSRIEEVKGALSGGELKSALEEVHFLGIRSRLQQLKRGAR